MPSSKPKIQLYLDADTEPHLRQWLENRKFPNDSAALNQLLREFFGIAKPEAIEPFDWRWAIKEAMAPLIHRIEALETKWSEQEEQARQERESPQPLSLASEALEPCQQQMYVIEQLQRDIAQKDIEFLRNLPSDSPNEIETYTEQIDKEINAVLAEAPKEDSPGESLGESEPEKPLEELSHNELVSRLNTKSNTLRGRRNEPGFNAWSQQKDPRGLVWRWDSVTRVYQGFKIKSI
jgi:hypothetical protein